MLPSRIVGEVRQTAVGAGRGAVGALELPVQGRARR